MILQALLGIKFPIIQTPMPGVQAGALAVAVSNAIPVSRPRLPKAKSASRPQVPAIGCPLGSIPLVRFFKQQTFAPPFGGCRRPRPLLVRLGGLVAACTASSQVRT